MAKNFDFVVLGATGMQGKIVSRDLLESGRSVLMCGRNKPRVEKILKDHGDKTDFEFIEMKREGEVADKIKKSGAGVVVNCVEGDWNLHALRASILAGAHCLDLGSDIPMTKDQFDMDGELKKKELISITGCGSVPGVGNVMLRYAADKFDVIDEIKVGFVWDSNIKKFVVPFSIQSIIEEFTDPAPVVINRRFLKRFPLESIVEMSSEKLNRQKCFLVRHPETYTFYQYFKDKGVKNVKFYAGFPEHSFKQILSMIELGLGSNEEIDFRGAKVKPVEFLTEVLRHITPPAGYEERENLWVEITGAKDGVHKKILMECVVPTLPGWEDAGCNIDTGMPASIMAQMVKDGIVKERGSFSPEGGIIPHGLFFAELAKRGMNVFENGEKVN